MQDIFEQVDEQLDVDRVQRFWEQNRKWVIGGLILFFAALVAYVQWRDYQVQQSYAASVQFNRVQELLIKKEVDNAHQQFQELADAYANHGYVLLGRFLQARSLADAGKTEEAVAQLEHLIQGAGTSPLVDLARLNAAYLTAGDRGRAEAFLNRIQETSPYRAHALELLGLLAAQGGEDQAALAHYQAARALTPEGTLRQRMENRLERLTVAEAVAEAPSEAGEARSDSVTVAEEAPSDFVTGGDETPSAAGQAEEGEAQ